MSRLGDVQRAIKDRRADLDRRTGRRDRIEEELADLSRRLAEAEETKELARKGQILVDAVAVQAREEIAATFERIVTRALVSILGEGYEFEVVYSTKRNAAHADFLVHSPDHEGGEEPVFGHGGGVVDVVSFVVRVVLLELRRPRIDGPIILDEPFKHLSSEFIPAAAALTRRLCERFGRQVLVVTHQGRYAEDADHRTSLGSRA